MTYNSYPDIYDTTPPDLEDTLGELEALRTAAAAYRLPPSIDRAVVQALTANAQSAEANLGSTHRHRGILTPRLHFRPRRLSGLRFLALTAALFTAICSILIFASITSAPAPPASAAAVVLRNAGRFSIRAGDVGQFTYRLTVAGGRWGPAVSSISHIWVRGPSAHGPEVEAALVRVPSIRIGNREFFGGYAGYQLVIGTESFRTSNLASDGPPANYAFYMSHVEQMNSDPIDFVLSHGGAQTARFLERSLGRVNVTTRPGVLDGHRVDVLTIDHWPGTHDTGPSGTNQESLQRVGPLVLYFDRRSHVLRGLDGRGLEPGAPERRWSIRLVYGQANGAGKAWVKILRLIRPGQHATTTWQGLRWTPIAIDLPSVAELRTACPGIPHLDADLWQGLGALGACRTVEPGITASKLLADLEASDKRQLALAVNEDIFSRKAVKASLTFFQQEVLSGMTRTPRSWTARVAWARRNLRRGQITREEALNDLLF